jgi:hypothetical protein
MAHLHAGFGLPFSIEDIYMVSKAEANAIRDKFQMKCAPFLRWLSGNGTKPGTEFYGNHPCDSIVLMRNADYDLFYASGNEDSFKEMHEFLSTLGEAY